MMKTEKELGEELEEVFLENAKLLVKTIEVALDRHQHEGCGTSDLQSHFISTLLHALDIFAHKHKIDPAKIRLALMRAVVAHDVARAMPIEEEND